MKHSLEPIEALQRTARWHTLWIWLIVLLGLVVAAFTALAIIAHETGTLQTKGKGNSLYLSPLSEGPFVVTHLYTWGGSERENKTAVLSPPIAIVDSEGGAVRRISTLKWTDYRGEPASPPGEGDPIIALYFRAEQARPQGTP